MSPDSSTLVSPLEGPKQVMSLVIYGLHWRQRLEGPAVLRYTFMIDAAYLYHNQQVHIAMYQIQQTISHEDVAFHENAMGLMYQINIAFSLT